MNRRALGIALVFAILGIFLLLLYQRRFEAEASGGERIEVLQAIKDIERGTVITEEMVATRKVPIAYTEDRAIKAADRQRLFGLKATTTVRAQQTLLWTDLISAGEERKDLSSLIRPGNVGMPIRLSRDSTSIALIRPGDYVDVFAILGENGRSDKSVATLLLQHVLVLATGTDTSPLKEVDPKQSYRNDDSITLSVNPRDAQLLALAGDRGRLAVAVRRADDTRQNDVPDISEVVARKAVTTPTGGAKPTGPVPLQPTDRNR